MKLVYAPLYSKLTNDLECIVRAPEGSSHGRVENAVNDVFHEGHADLYMDGMLTDAEAETLLEMKVCSFVDFSDPSCWAALAPMQGYRDEQGNRIEIPEG